MKKQGIIKRETVFFILVALIIVATIVIIICMNRKNNDVDDKKSNLEANVNIDASPETNPDIGGVDNVEEINGKKVNTSSKLKEAITVDVYTFSNIKMEIEIGDNKHTVITATITSTVTEKTPGRDGTIKFYDKEGELVSQMEIYIPQVKPGERIDFSTETTADVSNAYDIEIILR